MNPIANHHGLDARAATRVRSQRGLNDDDAPETSRSQTFDYYRRRAPTQVDEYQPLMLEILTTSPVCGEWMNWPPPM
jgi:hypothetical protein